MHGNTFVNLLRIVKRFVQIVVNEGKCQLAEDWIEQRVTRHRIGNLQQSVLQNQIMVHKLFTNVVGHNLPVILSMNNGFAIEGIGG